MLGALPGDPVELGLGELQVSLTNRNQGLHRPFAEGLPAQHQSPAVVLNGSGEDLRSRGAEAVHQDRQRAAIDNARVRVRVNADEPPAVADLHHRASIDEQAHELDGFLERPATVVPKIDDQPADLCLLQLRDQPFHVTGGALVVGIPGSKRGEVHVERRQPDDADLLPARPVLDLHDPAAGLLILEIHLVANDPDDPSFLRGADLGNDLETNRGLLGSANQGHHLVQAHAQDVHHLPFLALSDPDDTIPGPQVAGLVGRPADNQPQHLDALAIPLQNGADAFQRQAHVYVEVLTLMRRKI